MANKVTAVQLGGQPQTLDGVCTVRDIMKKFDLENVSIKVNGQNATPETVLADFNFVSFGEKVKGGV